MLVSVFVSLFFFLRSHFDLMRTVRTKKCSYYFPRKRILFFKSLKV